MVSIRICGSFFTQGCKKYFVNKDKFLTAVPLPEVINRLGLFEWFMNFNHTIIFTIIFTYIDDFDFDALSYNDSLLYNSKNFLTSLNF